MRQRPTLATSVAEAPPQALLAARQGRARGGAYLISGALLVFAVLLSFAIGAKALPLGDVLGAIFGTADPLTAGIISSRLDRTLNAVAVGACVSVAGAVLQGLTRNPIAEPGILGLTSGGALAIVIGLEMGLLSTGRHYLVAAFIGVVLAGVLVQMIASSVPSSRAPVTSVLAGAAVMAACTSVMAVVLLGNLLAMDTFRRWQVGTVAGSDTSLLLSVFPAIVIGLLISLSSYRILNALALGDDMSRTLGQRVRLHRGGTWFGALLLTASATAIAGPIAFVGLAVPHIVRFVMGPDYRHVLVGSLIGGPILMLLSDVIGRVVIPPAELQAGIVTALAGAPILLILARRQVKR